MGKHYKCCTKYKSQHVQPTHSVTFFFVENKKAPTDLMILPLLLKVRQVVARDDFAAELALGRLKVLSVFL